MNKVKNFLFFAAILGLWFACSENELTTPCVTVTDINTPIWNDVIQQLDFKSNMLLVENNGSIQEAIDAVDSICGKAGWLGMLLRSALTS